MREIKFRGKRIDNGGWVYGDYFGGNIFDLIVVGIRETDSAHHYLITESYEVNRETVGQYTGLKDKNGAEIYEGDVINLINSIGGSTNAVCEFGNAKRELYNNLVEITGFYFKLEDGRKTFPIVQNYLGKHDLEISEVIGNIHDNHELLEVSNV